MDAASRTLAQPIPHDVRDTLRGRAEYFDVRRSIVSELRTYHLTLQTSTGPEA